MKEKVHMDKVKHTRRVRLWFVLVILVLCGAAAWVLYDGGIIGGKNAPVAVESVSEQINENVVPESDAVKSDSAEIRPACAVIEDTLLTYITDDRIAIGKVKQIAQKYIPCYHNAVAQKMRNCLKIWPRASRQSQMDCVQYMGTITVK